jgi:peroxiredoxin
MTIEPPDYRPGMHVSSLTGWAEWTNGNEWAVAVEFIVLDDNQQPVAGATVLSKWKKGLSGNASCITGANGRCTVSGSVSASQDKAQLQVLSVSHSMLVNNGSYNSISVIRP